MIPNSIIFGIDSALNSVDEGTREVFLDAFSNFTRLLHDERLNSAQKKKALSQLSMYLKKKADEIDPLEIEKNSLNLRRIRNEFAHGKYRKDVDFSAMYASLWKAIVKRGIKIGPHDLENLLSYTLRVENLDMANRGASPAKIVSIYRPIFNALPENAKNAIFTELLLRLFSDPESLSLLDGTVRK